MYIRLGARGREDDHRNVSRPGVRLDLNQDIVTANLRQIQIEQDEIKGTFPVLTGTRDNLDAFGPILGDLYFHVRAKFIESFFEKTNVSRVVFDDQHVDRPDAGRS